MGKKIVVGPSYPTYDGRYLELPYTIPPNLEVRGETSWNARKFHNHAMKPLLSKKVATQCTSLKDSFAAFPQSAKHITESVNKAYVLARRADHLARVNNNVCHQVDILKKRMTTKNSLIEDGDEELSTKKLKVEELSKVVEERDRKVESMLKELDKEKATEAKKAWAAEKQDMEARYEELQRVNDSEIIKASKDLEQLPKRTRKQPYCSYRSQGRQQMGPYLTLFVNACKNKVSGLVDLYNEEMNSHPDWFNPLSLDEPTGEKDNEEDVELSGEGCIPPT
ncbi:hypothetical protein LIER_41035 [Lithospermum erythrorhizon]|uniref:Uncharacterized protein n=1 Tax=Lithospermum erythrorhizon TaxID=34254 RepID=A0AAV3R7I6_LITER